MTLLQENKNIVSSRAKSRDLSAAIINTLKYSNHFAFPLTLEEIHTRLVGERSSRPLLNHQITQMLKTKSIFQSGNYFYLPGQSHLVALRKQNLQFSRSQLSTAKELANKLSKIPGVLSIYLTGSLAMSNSNPDSDIDFMIITQNGRLWTTRFLLTIYTTILGLRRSPNSKSYSSKLCLNLYLSPNSYLLPPDRRSLYTAYELIQAVPLYDPTNTHSKILSANPWIHDYLPNMPMPQRTVLKRNSRLRVEKGSSADERTVLNGILGLLEYALYNLQLLYMRRKITREYITRDCAFFHPHNPAPKI